MRLPTFYELFLIPNWGIDSFIAKVRDIKFKAKVDDADIEKLTDDRKKLIENESKLLEDHRKKNKEILTRHFYDMSNMMSRNEVLKTEDIHPPKTGISVHFSGSLV